MNVLKTWMIPSILTGLTILSQAQERSIKRKDLPPAVEKTVVEQSKDVLIKGLSTGIEKGKRVYEAELSVEGHERDLVIDDQGKVLEAAEEVSIDALSPNVKEGLVKSAGKGKISKVESLTKDGQIVAYAALVKRGTKRSEIQVGPNGEHSVLPSYLCHILTGACAFR